MREGGGTKTGPPLRRREIASRRRVDKEALVSAFAFPPLGLRYRRVPSLTHAPSHEIMPKQGGVHSGLGTR